MNFDLNEEQQMLQDSVRKYIQNSYDLAHRRQNCESAQGFSNADWQTFAELGWLSVPFEESFGGFGGGMVDTMVVMEALGSGLVVEPYTSSVLFFGGLLQQAGNEALQSGLLPSLIEGKLQGAVAYLERQSRFVTSDVTTRASLEGGHYRLNGEKVLVANALAADKFIVTARTSGAQCDEHGITLLLVDAQASGISKTGIVLMDGQKVAHIRFEDVEVPADAVVGEVDGGHAALEQVIPGLLLAQCAEAMGIMQKLLDSTVEYSKTRKQFGTAIGSFQALQHRMVDMFMACEQTRSLLYRAACSMDDDSQGEDEVLKNVHALKMMVGKAGKLIGDEALQLHGGIGMTDELDVGHYVKRLMTIATTFGNADFHTQQFARLSNPA